MGLTVHEVLWLRFGTVMIRTRSVRLAARLAERRRTCLAIPMFCVCGHKQNLYGSLDVRPLLCIVPERVLSAVPLL